jgi:hypothetical protein
VNVPTIGASHEMRVLYERFAAAIMELVKGGKSRLFPSANGDFEES